MAEARAAATGSTKISDEILYQKKKNEELGKSLAKELELEGIEALRQGIARILEEKEALAKELAYSRQTISERDAEISHLKKRLEAKEAKISRMQANHEKSTTNYLLKMRKKDLKICEITAELEETMVKYEKVKYDNEAIEEEFANLSFPKI
jgi:chromosome segregation ATPase